ncbi:MAG: 6,7-dimethyl-8-ribityllumazine synthase [Acidobacteriota bacterium]
MPGGKKGDSLKDVVGGLDATELKIGIVVSRFNELVTDRLLRGALEILRRAGVDEDRVTVVRVPGSFEIPFAAQQLAASQSFDAIVCLGALIRGETDHYEYLAAEVTRGIAEIGLKFDLPVTFGVITAGTVEQALNRAGLKHGNKGTEATLGAIEMVHLKRALRSE